MGFPVGILVVLLLAGQQVIFDVLAYLNEVMLHLCEALMSDDEVCCRGIHREKTSSLS